MEKEEYKPIKKMRIQLLDDQLRIISDRLVDANTELYQGPKGNHNGPLRLELTLTDSSDIEGLKSYLDMLTGKLPIKAPTLGRGRPLGGTISKLESPREDILLAVEKMVEEKANQDQIINYLRNDLGFVFLLTEDFKFFHKDFKFRSKDIGEPNKTGQYPNSYCWLVKRTKMSKDPKADKYDPMIIFGFNILNKRTEKFVAYLYREFKWAKKAEIPNKTKISFASFEMAKMPHYMLEEERLKWSQEMRLLMDNEERKPSKFFLRWASEVYLPKGHRKKLEHLNVEFSSK